MRLSAWDFTSQQEVRLRLYFLERAGNSAGPVQLNVMDDAGWKHWLAGVRAGFGIELTDELALAGVPNADADAFARLGKLFEPRPRNPASALNEPVVNYAAHAFFAPRGIGMTAWSGDAKKQTQIRRRFMLLGQTLDGMRVWDIRRALQIIHFVREADSAKVDLSASGPMAVNAGFASLFEPGARLLLTKDQFLTEAPQPDYLNVLKVLDFRQAMEMAEASVGRSR